PGINIPRAEVGAATDRSELLADLIATGKRIENLKSKGRPGEQFQLMALEWLRQSDERAREALSKPPAIPPGLLAALEGGEGLDAEGVRPALDKLDEVAKGKGLESL